MNSTSRFFTKLLCVSSFILITFSNYGCETLLYHNPQDPKANIISRPAIGGAGHLDNHVNTPQGATLLSDKLVTFNYITSLTRDIKKRYHDYMVKPSLEETKRWGIQSRIGSISAGVTLIGIHTYNTLYNTTPYFFRSTPQTKHKLVSSFTTDDGNTPLYKKFPNFLPLLVPLVYTGFCYYRYRQARNKYRQVDHTYNGMSDNEYRNEEGSYFTHSDVQVREIIHFNKGGAQGQATNVSESMVRQIATKMGLPYINNKDLEQGKISSSEKRNPVVFSMVIMKTTEQSYWVEKVPRFKKDLGSRKNSNLGNFVMPVVSTNTPVSLIEPFTTNQYINDFLNDPTSAYKNAPTLSKYLGGGDPNALPSRKVSDIFTYNTGDSTGS